MGRPKGSKSKPRLDSSNILEPVLDENQNVSKNTKPPNKSKKSSPGTRKRSRDVQFWKDLVGPPIEFFPPYQVIQEQGSPPEVSLLGGKITPLGKGSLPL